MDESVVNAMLCDGAFVMNGQVLVKGGVRRIFAGSVPVRRVPFRVDQARD